MPKMRSVKYPCHNLSLRSIYCGLWSMDRELLPCKKKRLYVVTRKAFDYVLTQGIYTG
jgi:hypothetical protein